MNRIIVLLLGVLLCGCGKNETASPDKKQITIGVGLVVVVTMKTMVLAPSFGVGVVAMTMMHILRRGMSCCLLRCAIG